MSEETFIKFVKEFFDVTVTKEMLYEPGLLLTIYKVFLSNFGFNFAQPDLEAIGGISNINSHSEVLEKANIVNAMREIVGCSTIKGQFMLKDLDFPEKKRTMAILSHLVRKTVEHAESHDRWAALEETARPRIDKINEIEAQTNKLKETLAELTIQYTIEEREHQKKIKEFPKIVKENEEAKGRAKELEAIYASEKKDLSDIKEKLAEAKVYLQREKEELEELKAQLVTSPDKIMKQVDVKKDELNAKYEENRKVKFELSQIKTQIDTLTNFNTKFEALKQRLEVIIESLDEKFKPHLEELARYESENRELRVKLEKLNVELNIELENTKKLEKKRKEVLVNCQRDTDSRKVLLQEVLTRRDELKDKLVEKEKRERDEDEKLMKLIQSVEKKRQLFTQEVEKMTTRVKEVENSVNERMLKFKTKFTNYIV